MNQAYYVKLQGHKTLKYGGKQNYQHYLVLPKALCRIQDLETGQIFKLRLNEDGEIIFSRANRKPARTKMTYAEWIDRIKPKIPTQAPGKTYSQICDEAKIHHRSAPALWVRQAEHDIGLVREPDKGTHRVLWLRFAPQTSKSMPHVKEMKLTDPKYVEPQVTVK